MHPIRRIAVLSLTLLMILTFRQTIPTGAQSEEPTSTSSINRQEMGLFMDEFWQNEMQPLGIAGATFVLVKDGQTLFSKGYGSANIASSKPVDPASTLFAVGSVSKAVTAGAVLQLVEGGLLDLDEPVNSYLKSFQIGKTCTSPVTTSHLLTHTAGFDERAIGAFVLSPSDLVPLAEYEADQLPPCIRPPGQEMSYCNHCFGLAGLLVEEISGQPFFAYIEENLFAPLKMEHSSFRQPLPAELVDQRATGYLFTPQIQPAPLTYANFYPSGGMWATGEDMGRLITGYLEGGLLGGEQVFHTQTLHLLHERQFSMHPLLEGWTYGFFEHFENGQRLIGKDGDTPGFSSMLYLMPDQGLGFFLSYNATLPTQPGVVDPRLIFPSRFLERFFPQSERTQVTSAPLDQPTGTAVRLDGLYRWARYSHTSVDKIISPMSLLQWRVSSQPDDSLILTYPSLIGGQASRWVEVEPGLFQNPENGSYLAYRQAENGYVTHLFTKITEEGVLERVAWFESNSFQAILLVSMVVAFVSYLVILFVTALRGRHTRRETKSEMDTYTGKELDRLTRWTAGLISGLCLFILAVLALTVRQSLTVRAPQLPAFLPALLVIPLLVTGLTTLMVGLTVVGWKDRVGTFGMRIMHTILTLASLAFLWFCWYWNLLGFKL